jgi:hypothetical protein
MCKLKFILRGYKLMNKMKIFVLGSLIMSIFSLIAIIADATVVPVPQTWPPAPVSPASNLIIITGGPGISINTIGYAVNPTLSGYTTTTIAPTNLQPGDTVIITVPFTSTNNYVSQNVGLAITGITDLALGTNVPSPNPNDLASQTTAVVWISPSTTTELAPVIGTGSVDYVLGTTTGLTAASTLSAAPTPIQLGDNYQTSGPTTGNTGTMPGFTTGTNIAYYKLKIPDSTSSHLANAETQSLSIATTITGS